MSLNCQTSRKRRRHQKYSLSAAEDSERVTTFNFIFSSVSFNDCVVLLIMLDNACNSVESVFE
ncbi:hypothetical protein TSUD_277950 [Trifolium subterraneum]|uniref:Uncharacterized protein n=1 Tax=Trifolium subterraneum TaxID=3900 RepID=A0A2Z6MI10_TRISU|nr:hypothetical protein TSUD_277950 [Trifolium subterraneum]